MADIRKSLNGCLPLPLQQHRHPNGSSSRVSGAQSYGVCRLSWIALISGEAYEGLGQIQAALACYETATILIEEKDEAVRHLPELRRLHEAFLLRYCALDSPTSDLKPFRAWRDFCGPSYTYSSAKHAHLHRPIWRRYYQQLAGDRDLVEFNAVQDINEQIILAENAFPHADATTPEIDDWVDLVMENWHNTPPSEAQSRLVLEVHYNLAEFDLATKAVDTYLDLVQRHKIRAEKSGPSAPGSDNDSTIIDFLASALIMLCCLETPKATTRAFEITAILEIWLKPHLTSTTMTDESVLPPILSRALCASGRTKAAYSRLTHDSDTRTQVQETAIENLRQALRLGQETNAEVLYHLACILAETRDIFGAFITIKEVLGNAQLSSRSLLLRCWHLLVLLLTSREDYDTALASCYMALDLYGGANILHDSSIRLLDISDQESRGLLSFCLTFGAVIEQTKGSSAALQEIKGLLGLFAKMFPPVVKASSATTSPAPSTAKSHRSLRGSILGLSRDHRRSKLGFPSMTSLPPLADSYLGRHESNKLRKRASKRSHLKDAQYQSDITSDLRQLQISQENKMDQCNGNAETPLSSDEIGLAVTHNLPSSQTSPQRPRAPKALESRQIEPQFPQHIRERQRQAMLIEIWLVIARLYGQCDMYEDAAEALTEARSALDAIDESVATHEGKSAANLAEPGYCGWRSCSQLRADILCAEAAIMLMQGREEEACNVYEVACSNDSDHVDGTTGLSNILLDRYARYLNQEHQPQGTATLAALPVRETFRPPDHGPSPEWLTVLAGRDRCGSLLSMLTRSGQGWAHSEAWTALGRALELSEQPDRAREAYWWVVELENSRPLRPWHVSAQF